MKIVNLAIESFKRNAGDLTKNDGSRKNKKQKTNEINWVTKQSYVENEIFTKIGDFLILL